MNRVSTPLKTIFLTSAKWSLCPPAPPEFYLKLFQTGAIREKLSKTPLLPRRPLQIPDFR